MEPKQELLRLANHEFAALKEAIAAIDPTHMTRAWLGTWGVREILIHISGWHREMIPALERMARGERPMPEGASYEDVDAWNARFVARKVGAGIPEVLGELDASHGDFVAAARTVPAERFAPGKTTTKIVELNGPHHYHEHGEQIREWRRREGV